MVFGSVQLVGVCLFCSCLFDLILFHIHLMFVGPPSCFHVHPSCCFVLVCLLAECSWVGMALVIMAVGFGLGLVDVWGIMSELSFSPDDLTLAHCE